MGLSYWNIVVDDQVITDPWGSPWLCSVERAIEVAEMLNPGVELYPTEPLDLSLVEQVKAYARAHYNTGGWDVIVEAWDDDAIRKALGVWDDESRGHNDATSIEEVITKSTLSTCVDVWADRQADAENSAF